MSGIYVHFLPSRSEIRFTKCFRRELDRPIYQVPDGTCPKKGFFRDTKVLGDAVQDAKRKRATRKVVYISSSFWLLAPGSRDSSQAEKKVAVSEAEQIKKNDNYLYLK